MKAMILAAGRGKRMMPLTAMMPKPMLEVAGKPLLEHHLIRLVQAGITDIVINLAWQGDKIRAYFGDGSAYGVSIQYSEEPEGGLETAGGIVRALPLLCEDEDAFIVINGDIFTDYALHDLSRLHLLPGEAHLVLVENPPHNPQGDFPLAHQFTNTQAYTFAGIGLYHKDFFSAVNEQFLALGPLLREGLAQGQISTELYLGQWHDIGTPERLAQINKAVGQVHVG
ncbi:mannose-1-phosphate guanylyltransferase [Pseudoalteromonas rubra]|uniref:Mannose-1-phosphate guanylyltransferase n=1 Tax=Pseudoalteromonas rubra TaxID=43658 RepID=A0A5S3WF36_9GAMM|nr:nucleotidyltransferase family protein [Pseudoalteromonas rubra]TMP22895.1 mannose-1-phosphate guanylyltransferase [Pseudoalteromonas rubra]TMP27144.1 mannose-1-phosphate guanylyltransferase [Pseudoalteromonas rubra]